MRQGPNKRPRGRNGRKQNVPLRLQTFDSNGPEVRIRGNAYQVHEKYLALARDATASGDRIGAENFYQHAEHYFRIINVNTEPRQQPANPRPPADGENGSEVQASGNSGNGEATEAEAGTEPAAS